VEESEKWFLTSFSRDQVTGQPTCTPTITPVYNLVSQPQTNFDLAAHFHRLSYQGTTDRTVLCEQSNTCNQTLWQKEWSTIIQKYNSNSPGYGLAIVTNGDGQYAPQNPNR
jgi:hypothetical protein